VKRVRLLFDRHYAVWIAANLAALRQAPVPLTAEARALLDALDAPAKPGLSRPRALARHAVSRQTRFGNACLYLAAALGRI
jgi:hypothetical protein